MITDSPAQLPAPGGMIVQTGRGAGGWRQFAAPREIIRAHTVADVKPALARVAECACRGAWVAGYVCYEAAPAFDPALVTAPPASDLPLLWFGVYDQAQPVRLPSPVSPAAASPAWTPNVRPDEYAASIDRIRAWIAAGDTYQVNHTLRLRGPWTDNPWPLFLAMTQAQGGLLGACLNLGNHVISCASPELFFDLRDGHVRCCPMKGTAPRGCGFNEDRRLARHLHRCEKNRAENLMIVDMVRNDLGRVAIPGTVCVPHLFRIETFRTVLQMTSVVTAETRATLPELFAALFPSASITGAPKVRAMQIIAGEEKTARGVYTGAIGVVAPGGRCARFNVAIRTAVFNRAAGTAEYGVGGGIVWDSSVAGEYAECIAKTRVLTAVTPSFQLLETLRWTPGRGYILLEQHLRRLQQSARYFRFHLPFGAVRRRLTELATGWGATTSPQRVRLLVSSDGIITLEHRAAPPVRPRRPWRLAVALSPVAAENPFLYHKTTHRAVYETARQACPECEDVVLWNARGEVTETTIANLAIKQHGGRWVTPPVACGLLPGTLRERLLARGTLREAIITRDDLRRADAIVLFNSVRGLIRGVLYGNSDLSSCPS